MEALGSVIKDRLISVQEEINNGLKKLSLAEPPFLVPTDPHSASSFYTIPSRCDLNAGAQLLCIYQNDWKAMSEASAENIKRAKEADRLLQAWHQKVTWQCNNVARLNHELRGLETVGQSVLELRSNIGSIKKYCYEVEKSFIVLENLVEVQEFQHKKIEFSQQLTQERERRLLGVEELKAQLAREHAQKVQLEENQHTATARERQAVFDEVFNNELSQYKLYGKLPRPSKPSTNREDESQVLMDIHTEEDLSSLNSFLDG